MKITPGKTKSESIALKAINRVKHGIIHDCILGSSSQACKSNYQSIKKIILSRIALNKRSTIIALD